MDWKQELEVTSFGGFTYKFDQTTSCVSCVAHYKFITQHSAG